MEKESKADKDLELIMGIIKGILMGAIFAFGYYLGGLS